MKITGTAKITIRDISVNWCPQCNQLQKFLGGHRTIERCGICGHAGGDWTKYREIQGRRAKLEEEAERERTRLVTVFRKDYSHGCKHCTDAGIEHQLIEVPCGHTDALSRWGPGLPMHKRKCTNCGREDGPWVPSCGD